MKKLLLAALLGGLLSACGHSKDAKSFEALLEAATGQPHQVVKLNTEEGEFVVYQNKVTGEFVAYNMAKFDRKAMTSLDQFLAVAQEGLDIVHNLRKDSVYIEDGYWRDITETEWYYEDYYDDFCECWKERYVSRDYVVGHEWVDTSYWKTFYVGGGYVFDNTSARSKDLELVASLEETAVQKFVAGKLSSEFSLSSNRSDELAKLVTRYQKLDNARELTTAEKNVFAKDALGVSLSDIERALKQKSQGKEEAYKDLLKSAANVNKTTPEQIGSFFDKYVAGAELE